MEKQNDRLEQPESQTKKEKWFDWHFYPNPLEVRSIIEIIVFLTIICLCGFLYYRWNVVPQRSFEFNVENLGTNRVFDSKKNDITADSLSLGIACHVKYVIPMTTHQEFVKDSTMFSTTFYPIYSYQKYSKLIETTFVKDSIVRNSSSYITCFYGDSIIDGIMKETGLYEKYESWRNREYDGKEVLSYLQTLKAEAESDLCYHPDSSILVFSKHYGTLPYFSTKSGEIDTVYHGLNYEVKYKNVGNTNSYTNSYFWSEGSWAIFPYDSLHTSEKHSFGSEQFLPSNRKQWNEYNFLLPFRGGHPMETPSWLRLEDISQTYVDLKINSFTVDSIVLCMDFVGVTDFSNMEPSPDSIGMSKIIFSDPIKIFKIRADGLKFHAKFRELENIQEIRVFTVTTVMSAFTLALVIFVISAFLKIRNKLKRKLEQEKASVKTIMYYGNLLLWGLIIYHFIYWTIMYSVDDLSILECNLIAIPIVIIILIFLFEKIRRVTLSIIDKIGIRNIIMFFSLFIFILLISISSYRILSMNFDDILKAGDYRRATRLMYDSIMSKDTISESNYNNVRKVLIGEGHHLLNNQLGNYKIEEISDNTLVFSNSDTVALYNIPKNIFRKYTFTKIDRVRVDDKFIKIYNTNNNCTLVDKNSLNIIPIKIPGTLKGFTNDSCFVLSTWNDTLYYTRILPKVGKNKKLIFRKGWLQNIGFSRDYINRSTEDSINGNLTFFIKRKGNKLKNVIINNKKYIHGNWHIFDEVSNIFYNYTDDKYKLLKLSDGKADYISLKKAVLENGIKGSWNWNMNMNKLRLLKSILSRDDKLLLVGVDSSKIYLFNRDKYTIETYQDGVYPSQSVLVVKEPEYTISSKGVFFVCEDNGIVYVYNNEKLLYKKQLNIKFKTDKYNSVPYPIANPSDSIVVYDFPESGDNYVYGKWLINTYSGKNSIRYIENDSTLIFKNKYLSNHQKRELLNKLKKFRSSKVRVISAPVLDKK